jgi:hypothetical protein
VEVRTWLLTNKVEWTPVERPCLHFRACGPAPRTASVMPKEEVIAQIEAAFADTPAPGDKFEDISATSYGEEGVVDYFRGTTWRGHRTRDLRIHDCALSYFTDKAFRYWLPAFMIAELEDPVVADVIGEGIAFHLTESDGAAARLRQFAQGELEAIAAFLEECARRYADGIYDTMYLQAASAVRARIQQA